MLGELSNEPGASERLEEVPVGEISVGDVLLVRAGEVVPVDAVLLAPAASFDESSLTGDCLLYTSRCV